MNKSLALLLAFVGAIQTAPAADVRTAFLVLQDGRGDAALWSATTSGVIALVQSSFGAGTDEGYFNGAPAVSPDGKMLVFARRGDLWIHDLGTSVERRITDAARPYDGHNAWVSIEVRAWSPRGDQLLYEIVRPDRFPRSGCEGGPAPVVREAPYGVYLYDLASGASRSISLPGRFDAWLSDQEVVVRSEPNPFLSPAVRVKLGSSEHTPLPLPDDRFCGQLSPDAEGSLLLASCVWDRKSQLMELNLRGGQLRSITPEGEFAEFQWPRFSPTGRRIAWIHQFRQPGDRAVRKLVVDSKPVFTCNDVAFSLFPQWIDDDTLFCTCAKELFVIDASTGVVKGTTAHPLAVGNY